LAINHSKLLNVKIISESKSVENLKGNLNMKISVKITETYKDHIVCKGKLVFINSDEQEVIDETLIMNNLNHISILKWALNEYPTFAKWRKVKPIVISETEEIKFENTCLMEGKIIKHLHEMSVVALKNKRNKILALPEKFSPIQIQAIVDGELKDGDNILLECEDNDYDFVATKLKGEPFKKPVILDNNYIQIWKPKEKEKLSTPMLDWLRKWIKETPLEQRQKEWKEACKEFEQSNHQ